MTQTMQQLATDIISGTASSNPYTTTSEIVELLDEVYKQIQYDSKSTVNFVKYISDHLPSVLACYGFAYAVDNHIIDNNDSNLFNVSIRFFSYHNNIYKHLNKDNKKQLLFDLARDGVEYNTIETEVCKQYDSSRYEDAGAQRCDFIGRISHDYADNGNLLNQDGSFKFPSIPNALANIGELQLADIALIDAADFLHGCNHVEFKYDTLADYELFESNGFYIAHNAECSYIFWPRDSRSPVPLWTTGWWLHKGDDKDSKIALVYREWVKAGLQLAKTGKTVLGKTNKDAVVQTYRVEMQCTHYAYVQAESAEEAETVAKYYDENPIFRSRGMNWDFNTISVAESDLPEYKPAKFIARGSAVGDWWDDDVFDMLGCRDSKLPWTTFDDVYNPPQDKIKSIDPELFVCMCSSQKFIWRNVEHLTCYELDGYYVATTSYDDDKFCYIFWPDGSECPTKTFTG